jgi:hypothetical protein
MKRSFVYSAVTLFDTTNTSVDTAPIGGAGSGVFGLVSFACGGSRFESLGVSLLFFGAGPRWHLVTFDATMLFEEAGPPDPGLDREQTSMNVKQA